MSFLNQVTTGTIQRNKLMLLYGPEGVGKSFFGANCPSPVFLGTERGTEFLDVSRLPTPNTWEDVLLMIEEISRDDHNFKTLVVDTLDWLEPLMYEFLLKEYSSAKVIEDICGGYGKWVNRVNMEWKVLIKQLEIAREKVNVVVLAHSHVKSFNCPINNAVYDRFQLKLHSQSACLLWKEYVDFLLFATFEVHTKKENKNDRKSKAYGDGERVLHTEWNTSFDAKNRCGLPGEIELDANKLFSLIDRNKPESTENIINEINSFTEKIKDESVKKLIAESILKHKNNYQQLVLIRGRVEEKLGEK